jgi:hypothetical protein
MTGGTISGNISTDYYFASFPNYGGGVYIIDKFQLLSAIFNKTGGIISGNTVIKGAQELQAEPSKGNQVFAAAAVPGDDPDDPDGIYGIYGSCEPNDSGAIEAAIQARPIAAAMWCDDTVGENEKLYYTTTLNGDNPKNVGNYQVVTDGTTWQSPPSP